MRHPLPFSERFNWRLIVMLDGMLGLVLASAIYHGAVPTTSAFGPDWYCPPNGAGSAVCLNEETKTPAQEG